MLNVLWSGVKQERSSVRLMPPLTPGRWSHSVRAIRIDREGRCTVAPLEESTKQRLKLARIVVLAALFLASIVVLAQKAFSAHPAGRTAASSHESTPGWFARGWVAPSLC